MLFGVVGRLLPQGCRLQQRQQALVEDGALLDGSVAVVEDLRKEGIEPDVCAHVALEQDQGVQLILCGPGRRSVLLGLRSVQCLLGGLVAFHHAVLHRLQRGDQIALPGVRVELHRRHAIHLEIVVVAGGVQLGAQVENEVRVGCRRKFDRGVVDLEGFADVAAFEVGVQRRAVLGEAVRAGFLVVDLFAFVGQLEGQAVGRVVLQHVEDELLLDGLAHGIDVERDGYVVRRRFARWIGAGAKYLHRLVLRRCGKRDEGDAAIVCPRRHLRHQDVFRADFAAVVQLRQFLGAQHRLQLRRCLAGLRAVRLVGDHREAFALGGGQLGHGFEGKGKGLDGADHDFLVAGKCLGQLAALAAVLVGDRGDHAAGALKVEQRFLKLRVDDVAVGDHQHGVEDLLVPRIVQLGEKVRGPRDGVGLARAGRMLNEILAARPVVEHGRLELARHVELMVAGEDDLLDLLLLVALGDEVTAKDFQPALACPHLLPQIGGAVAALIIAPLALWEGPGVREDSPPRRYRQIGPD
ncbi:MAG: hypothetical protein Q8O52_10520 [Sulfuritalea sp.]|nr:hypothetical protein [Sulfuritalea sp.]